MRRRIAYRKDWCNTCEGECHSERFRTFRLGHLYWIPLLPMGFFRTWECTTCHKDPRTRTKESVTTLILAEVLCGVFLVAVLAVDPPDADDRGKMWGIRVFLAACCIGLAWLIRKRLKEPKPVRTITPYPTDVCHYCKGRLLEMPVRGSLGHCEVCRVDLAAG